LICSLIGKTVGFDPTLVGSNPTGSSMRFYS
jgi:hypothetical protein